jgi:RND family efflux transporter MFP subunit
MQARALDAQQQAAAHEAARISSLLAGGFVSQNEAEQKTAETASKQAELLALKAQWTRASVGVGDCVLRAPFDGEISERLADPGVFARPGTPVAVIVDRSMVRVVADVPESDFDVVQPGTPVTVRDFATGAKVASTVARRAPSADASTRTIHIELDVPNPDRTLPVRTTAELGIDVGAPVTAAKVPLASASVRGTRASLFVVEGNVAHKLVASVVGERGGALFLDGALKPGALVVAEGRSTLKDGDRVLARLDRPAPSAEERAAARP